MYNLVSGESRVITLADVFVDFRRTRKLKPPTVLKYDYLLRKYLKDWLDKPIHYINKDRIEERHQAITEKGPSQANLVMRVLSSLMNYALYKYDDALGEPLLKINPVKRLSHVKAWNKRKRKKSGLHPSELKLWFSAVQALKNTADRDFLMVLILTGLRRGEAVRMEWENVNFITSVITIPNTKNGEDHNLPMPTYLYSLLLSRKQASRDRSRYVFPGRLPSMHIHENVDAHEKVAMSTGIKFAPHDCRRLFATVANGLGLPAYTIKALLNHKLGNDVTALYIEVPEDELRVAIQKICDKILELSKSA